MLLSWYKQTCPKQIPKCARIRHGEIPSVTKDQRALQDPNSGNIHLQRQTSNPPWLLPTSSGNPADSQPRGLCPSQPSSPLWDSEVCLTYTSWPTTDFWSFGKAHGVAVVHRLPSGWIAPLASLLVSQTGDSCEHSSKRVQQISEGLAPPHIPWTPPHDRRILWCSPAEPDNYPSGNLE